ncbi:TPA: glycosyltransferase [Photobacterium damselae]
MKILLVGEYSGVHTNLAIALKSQGHEVVTMSNGDGYKSFPRDINISFLPWYKKVKIPILSPIISIISDWLGITGAFNVYKLMNDIKDKNDFDVIQLINTAPISSYSSIGNYLLIKRLLKLNSNAKLFLCALGDDRSWVSASILKKYKYSCFDRMNIKNLINYLYSLKYIYGVFYSQLDRFVIKQSQAIIPGLLDYSYAYKGNDKLTKIIKIPLSIEQYAEAEKKLYVIENDHSKNGVINIFHGWQRGKELKKGNDVLDKVIKDIILNNEYKINYKLVQNLPYSEYIKCFNDADIFLDQIYSYDRGVNAILGMSNGKVVISGFENVSSDIGINGTPDEKLLYANLVDLLNNPERIGKMKVNAIKHILRYHNPIKISKEYLNEWSKY